MAVLYPCSLCRMPEKAHNMLKNNKKFFVVYSIFFVLLIEWISLFYLKFFHTFTENVTDFYITKMYPFLTNLALFTLIFSMFLWKERLHFCFRKSASTFYLSLYYLFNCMAILLCFNASIYYELVSYGFLMLASFLFFVSLRNHESNG